MVSSLQIPHKVAGERRVLAREQSVSHALLAGATRSPNPVGVRVDVAGNIVVDDGADGRDVQTTS